MPASTVIPKRIRTLSESETVSSHHERHAEAPDQAGHHPAREGGPARTYGKSSARRRTERGLSLGQRVAWVARLIGAPSGVEPVAHDEQRREDRGANRRGVGRLTRARDAACGSTSEEVQERDGRAQEISARVDQEGDPGGTARLGHAAIVNRRRGLRSRRGRRFRRSDRRDWLLTARRTPGRLGARHATSGDQGGASMSTEPSRERVVRRAAAGSCSRARPAPPRPRSGATCAWSARTTCRPARPTSRVDPPAGRALASPTSVTTAASG